MPSRLTARQRPSLTERYHLLAARHGARGDLRRRDHLIPLYAIGVFTSFTLSQSGMAVRHIKRKEPGWRLGLVINGGGAFATGVVTIIIAITKFTHGAWAVMLFVPILVAALVRLNHQYESEAEQLTEGVVDTVKLPVPVRHISVVMIDKLDNAAARALRMARTLRTDRTEALHIVIDPHHSDTLADDWAALRPDHIDLRLLDCPDRKLVRRALDYINELIADGETQVSVLIPQLHHNRIWHKLAPRSHVRSGWDATHLVCRT
jgi:hypothetical protein